MASYHQIVVIFSLKSTRNSKHAAKLCATWVSCPFLLLFHQTIQFDLSVKFSGHPFWEFLEQTLYKCSLRTLIFLIWWCDYWFQTELFKHKRSIHQNWTALCRLLLFQLTFWQNQHNYWVGYKPTGLVWAENRPEPLLKWLSFKDRFSANKKIFTPDLRFSLVDFPSVLIRLSGTYSVSCFLYMANKSINHLALLLTIS